MRLNDDGEIGRLYAIETLLAAQGLPILLDSFPDGVIIVGNDSNVRAANQVARDLLGETMTAIGAPSTDIFQNFGDSFSEIAVSANRPRRHDGLIALVGGRNVLLSIRVLRNGNADPIATVLVLRDLKLIEHQRRNAAGEREANLFQFLSDRALGPDYELQRRLSDDIERVITHGTRALRQGARLLLHGESGTGKTELARYLHRTVGDAHEPFVHVNCGAIPDSLFESEMFGYEKGAFTGALLSGKGGLLEAAHEGTLFLDEVAEIPLPLQAKLLKFLEDGEVQRIGGRTGRHVKSRVISATNRDLWKLVQRGEFRQDLYYRLAVITLPLSPLRANRALIAHLIDQFLASLNRVRSPHLRVSDTCRENLLSYSYPGNVRELHNIVQHLSVVVSEEADTNDLHSVLTLTFERENEQFTRERTASEGTDSLSKPMTLRDQVRRFEREVIERSIAEWGSKRQAALALGVDIGTIVRKTRE